MVERVVLVDEADRELGTREKLVAHQRGELHRALSVFLFDVHGRVLLQRRALGKYHSAGLWANACCSHPRPGEDVAEAARRRLAEELGVEAQLKAAGTFLYRAEVGAGLVEHELDHVFVGRFDGDPRLDPGEADAWVWLEPAALEARIAAGDPTLVAWLARAWALARGA
ncbi:MAG: isopentenyl-diphosphate Delta-isomerase [Planctomycetota bacterium]